MIWYTCTSNLYFWISKKEISVSYGFVHAIFGKHFLDIGSTLTKQMDKPNNTGAKISASLSQAVYLLKPIIFTIWKMPYLVLEQSIKVIAQTCSVCTSTCTRMLPPVDSSLVGVQMQCWNTSCHITRMNSETTKGRDCAHHAKHSRHDRGFLPCGCTFKLSHRHSKSVSRHHQHETHHITSLHSPMLLLLLLLVLPKV